MCVYMYWRGSAFLEVGALFVFLSFLSSLPPHPCYPVECSFVSDLKTLPQPEVYVTVGEGGQREHCPTLSAILTKSVFVIICRLFKVTGYLLWLNIWFYVSLIFCGSYVYSEIPVSRYGKSLQAASIAKMGKQTNCVRLIKIIREVVRWWLPACELPVSFIG